jgi:SRSO17 transposase
MLERLFAVGVVAAWVTADSVYGGDYKLRHFLEEREQPFVLAVPSSQRVGLSAKAEQVVASWSAVAWQRLSAGEGSQGPRWYDWAWMPMAWREAPTGMAHWLLARRSVSHPDEIAYYFVFGPDDATLAQVAQVAGMRWHALAGGAGLRVGQARGGAGRVRGAPLARLVSPYHPSHVRSCLSHSGPPARP